MTSENLERTISKGEAEMIVEELIYKVDPEEPWYDLQREAEAKYKISNPVDVSTLWNAYQEATNQDRLKYVREAKLVPMASKPFTRKEERISMHKTVLRLFESQLNLGYAMNGRSES